MKNKLKTLVVAMAISSSALAQTNTNTPVPTPSPTPTVSLWRSNDPSVSTADKIAAAQAELDDVSLSQHARKAASMFLLQFGAIQPDAVIQDPSLGGKIVDAKLQAALASSAAARPFIKRHLLSLIVGSCWRKI